MTVVSTGAAAATASLVSMRRLRALTVALLLVAFSLASPALAKETHKKTTQVVVKHGKVKRVAAPAFRSMPTATQTNNGRFATLIIDANTGEVLHQENADAPRRPASLTKMMTLYLTFQALDQNRLKLDSMLPVSQLAASQSPTKLDLRPGQRITVEDAILGLVTESANDAAVVLAEAVGGDVDTFAAKMTRTARGLGMGSTTYQNPNGLPNPGQVTTARDQAKLALALQRHYPRYYHYFSTPTFAYGGRMHPNHNRLMARYEGMDGIKTGFIRESGFNLVASCKRGDKRLIGVIFGGPSAAGRDNQLAALLDAAFARANSNTAELPRTQMAQAIKETTAPIVQAAAAVSTMNNAQAEPIAAPTVARTEDTGMGAAYSATTAAANYNNPSDYAPQQQPVAKPVITATAAANYQPASQSGTLQLPTQKRAETKVAAAASPAPARSTDQSRSAGAWGIQIGAYNDKASGQRATALVADSMPDLLQAASPRVLSVATGTGTIYRARLIGIDEKAARTACTRLQAKSRPCMTLPPSSGNSAWLASAEN